MLPPGEFPIFDIPITHPIMHSLYHVKAIPQVPNISFWRSATAGHLGARADSARCTSGAFRTGNGRLMVLMSHNTDIADTWEREGGNQEYFDLFSPRGYAIGVNVVLYAMTH